MAGPWILGFCFLSLQLFNIHCQKTQPEVKGSYRAIGELSTLIQISDNGTKQPVQVAFEENYDAENLMSVFTVWQSGLNETFVENLRTNTTFLYQGDSQCNAVSKEDYINIEGPPSLLGYVNDGKIRFPLQRLLSVDKESVKKSFSNKTFRGLPADTWLYEFKGKEGDFSSIITLYAYWANSTWNTTSPSQDRVPLGFKITKIVQKDPPVIEVQTINVFAFLRESLNKAAFKAREGYYCEGNVPSKFTFPTPPKVDAISVHSEIALASYLEVKHVDIFYDMKNKLLRIDMDRIDKQEIDEEDLFPNQRQRRITSEFTSKELGATFEADIYKGKFSCEVTKLDDYEFEAQDIINPKLDAKLWDLHHFFGVNTTKYRYIGKTVKRNIPCHVFQGLRTDWPETSSGTETLWEWCMAVNLTADDDVIVFRDNELPLTSLQIYFRNSTDEDFPEGSRLVHHFYDVLAEDPNLLYASAFDVSRCLTQDQKQKLQFTVDTELNETNIHIFENATSDPSFLQQWRDQIYKATELTLGSLRLAKVKSAIYNKVMYVTFTLLDAHPQLPGGKGKYKSLEDAMKNLTTAVDKGSVQIKYIYQKGKSLDLKAKPKTLVPQIDPTTMVHEKTTQPPPITKPTEQPPITKPTDQPPITKPTGQSTITKPTGQSTITKPTGQSTITESSKKPPVTGSSQKPPVTATPGTAEPNIETSENVKTGSGTGAVAGVTIAMLIVGFSLGAGGTFYKNRGLPLWMRRAG